MEKSRKAVAKRSKKRKPYNYLTEEIQKKLLKRAEEMEYAYGYKREIARELGLNPNTVAAFFRTRGFVKPYKAKPYNSEAYAIIERNAHRPFGEIHRALRSYGFQIAHSEIRRYVAEIGGIEANDRMSTEEMSDLLGVHPATIRKWLSLGYIRKEDGPNSSWIVRERDFALFVYECPTIYEHRLVDPLVLRDYIIMGYEVFKNRDYNREYQRALSKKRREREEQYEEYDAPDISEIGREYGIVSERW